MAAYTKVIYLGSSTAGRQMGWGIPSGRASGQPGVLVLPTGATTPTEYKLFVDTGGNLRITSGTAFGDSDGTAFASGAGANTALSNLAAVAINTSLVSDAVNTDDLGSDALPWRSAYVRTSLIFDNATRNLTLTASEPATLARTVNFGDPGANDGVVYLAAAQDLTTKTYNGLTLAGATNAISITQGTASIVLAAGNTDITLGAAAQINITAAKTLSIVTDLTVNTVAVTLNQALATTSSPTFVTITGTTFTDGTATLTGGALSTTSAITCRGITNTVTAISSTAAISIAADTVNLNLGATAQGKIYATGANMYFQDGACGPYSLQQIATGTTMNPVVNGDLTVLDGKFTWTDAADEVAGLWTFASAGSGSDIDIVTIADSGECLHIVANSLTTGKVIHLSTDSIGAAGTLIYGNITVASHDAAGFFLEFNNGATDVFSVGKFGATIIAGTAALTTALTLTAGDLKLTSGFLDIDSGIANGGHNIASADTGSSAVPLVTITNSSTAFDQPLLLLNGDATGAFDVLQITHDSTGYGLSIIGTSVTGKQALFQGPASQTTSSVIVDGETGSWIGAATVGMLHLKSDGALANAASSLLYSVYNGAVGAVQVLGTCAQFADTGAAGTNTWALGVASTNNNGINVVTSATGMTALRLAGPVGQTVSMAIFDGTATTGWVGAANTGMVHIAVDGATASATASAFQIVIGTGTPTTASTGYALKIADTTGVAANPDTTYAAYIGTLTNSGLSIVTAGATARNLVLSGVQSQTAAMAAFDGTTGTGWIGAATTGMVDLACDGATAATTTSVLQIRVGAGTPANTAGGYAIRVADTTAAAAAALTTYAVYISAANNEALKVDDGLAVFDEGICTQVAVTDVSNPPTNANMITAFGAVATKTTGFLGFIDDAGTGTKLYLCAMVNGKYWQVELTAGA